jgi:hypothetical protein
MTREEMWELMNAGDWACSQGDGEALSRVALRLSPELSEAGLIWLAERIASLARIDLVAASIQWGALVAYLRGSSQPQPEA